MRYLVGFVFVLALGVMPVVGCDDDPCDDGNPCTLDVYNPYNDPVCKNRNYSEWRQPCDFDGVPGLCVHGTCREDLCVNVNCDDGDTCSEDRCFPQYGSCSYSNGGHQGESCTRNGLPGVCNQVYCDTFDCADQDCDDGDLCTNDWCVFHESPHGTGEGYDECVSRPIRCEDQNACTSDRCHPDTGECVHEPVPEDSRCALSCETQCGGFCIPPCCTTYCDWGFCNNGVCE